MSKSKVARIFGLVFLVAASFKRRFTTEEFVDRFSTHFPAAWRYLVRRYAPSGKGAGHHHSAASRLAMMLLQLSRHGQITRRKYVAASPS